MPTCDTSVTTPTGVFTYIDKEVTKCEAKTECLQRGEILAPITNVADFTALKTIADTLNPDCKFHYGLIDYHIRLDINICGGRVCSLTMLFGTKLNMESCISGMGVKLKIETPLCFFHIIPAWLLLMTLKGPELNDLFA